MIIEGDALTQLKTLDSESVDCCITSPPYWALRDYKQPGQLGLEPTFQEYINKLIEIFNEVKRVLKRTGSCWVNLGDTYNPEKSLCLIPQRFQIQMVDQGWICRNTVIWYKPNCMPSSAKDRFTVDFEYLFFFTKNQKYYFDTQYEPLNPDTLRESRYTVNLTERKDQETRQGLNKWKPRKEYEENNVQSPLSIKKRIVNKVYFGGNKYPGQEGIPATYSGNEWEPNGLGRIKRAVWRISPQPFSEAHFAVFPEKLVETPIKATCPVEGTVLDPFLGSGTTALVALKNARNFIGIELNPDYITIANKRLAPYISQTRLI